MDEVGFADALVQAPRGRSLCLAVAHRVHRPVWAAMLQAAWHPNDLDRRHTLRNALTGVDSNAVVHLGEETGFVAAVGEAVDEARYWQEPDEQDVLLRVPEIRATLRPIAAAIAATDATAWWHSPTDRARLRAATRFATEGPLPGPPQRHGAAGRLAEWRQTTLDAETRAARDRPADPRARVSGTWWSTPVFADLTATTRPLPHLAAATLAWEEDSMGFTRALVWTMQCSAEARIYEVDSPKDWATLVCTYPLEVTASRRHDWYRATGRTGTWLIPDYPAIATDWDAIHVTVAGYLITATRAIPVDQESATVLAGWEPDQAWWLTDSLTSTGPPAEWIGDPDDGTWLRRSGTDS